MVRVGLMLTKLTTEILESVNQETIASLRSSGANFLQILPLAVTGFARESTRALGFYSLDQTFRYTIFIGALGGLGLGQVLIDSIRVYIFQTVSAVVILTSVALSLIQFASNASSRERDNNARLLTLK
tara:strand:- start:1126 stop:1509 length:384 start_codon:yes stop_codon:yes gene_type:complete